MKNFLLIICGFILFTSCEPNKVVEQYGRIRLINASSSVGDINMKVDYEKIYATNIQYLNYSLFRDYIVNDHKLQIINAAGTTIIDTSIYVEENKIYSVFVYDSLGSLKYKLIEEVFVAPVGSDCKVRFLNLSNDADVVDIRLKSDTTIQFLNYKNGDHSQFVAMNSGYNQFEVNYAGTANTFYTSYSYPYKPGAFYTMYLKGIKASTGTDSIGIFTIENHLNY